MALFTDPVDRFFVGKLVTGALFIICLLQLIRAIIALTGTAAFGVSSPAEAALTYGAGCAVWLLAFRFIDARRVKSRQSQGGAA